MTGFHPRGASACRLHTKIALAAAVAVVCCLLTSDGAWAAVASEGTQRWAASYDFGTPAYSFDVAVSPDGSTVFSTGTTVYGTGAPGSAATVAVDGSTGAVKWGSVYRSSTSAGQRDRGTRIALSPDGSKVFVTGESSCYSHCGSDVFNGYSTIAYDASSGDQLWASRYAEEGPGAYSIAVTPDGSTVFVHGGTPGDAASTTVAYDASTGAQLFVIQNAGLLVPWNALAISPDSSTVFVASTSDPTQSPCGDRVTAYDASTGTQLWTAVYPNCTWDRSLAITISPDGSTLYETGSGNLGFSTVAYDASTGAQRWATVTDQIRVDGDVHPSVAPSPDGTKLFVLGEAACASSCSDQPLATMAYDASTGNQLWEARYDSGGLNYPADLAVSGDGSRVFVTGEEQMPCHSPCTTTPDNAPLVAYDADTGTEAWVEDYLNNSAFALATSPAGSSVYVAGTFTPAATATAPRAAPLGAMARTANTCTAVACGYSMTAYNTHAGPGISQDRDPAPRFDGWRTVFDRTSLGGAYRASRGKGQNITFRTAKSTSVTWIAHRGPQEGKARVLVDGHSKGTFDLYARFSSRHAYTFKGLSRTSHNVTVEVLGTKDAASSGRWVTVDGFIVGGNVRQETALSVRYGRWTGKSSRAASGGSYRESGSSRARLSFAFTGRSITWVTATGRAYGRARVVIDGVAHTVDLFRQRHHSRVKILYGGLGLGTHTITLRPLGTKDASSTSTNVVFDAFVVH
jgi:sugar lactone lactonase YvrE